MPTSQMSEVVRYLRSTLLPEGPDLTDGQLLERFVSRRDPAALEALVWRHAPMVWAVCRRVLGNHHDAEDAFQASFLVLVRKAASIRTNVGNWLYGVAHQTALKARSTRAKRRGRENPVTQMPEPAATQQDLWTDLQPLLDQELSWLPEKYRTVIVLCELEGNTLKDAARQLGCPEGTVASRLARARTMLAKRLARHGLAVTGGALAAVVSQSAASACVPAAVLTSTIKAVTGVAAGQAASSLISAQAAALAEGAMKAMLLNKLKALAAVLFVVAVLGAGAAGLTHWTQAAAQPEKGAPEASDKERKEKPGARVKVVTAQVVYFAYMNNDAKGDKEYFGERLRITGKLWQVKGVTPASGKKPFYLLTVYSVPGRGQVTIPVEGACLAFKFDHDARAKLAKLESGEDVTIEGKCIGRTADVGDLITFSDCKLIEKK
jgi:RNA polymerase sigma factor (sigma-70 family)